MLSEISEKGLSFILCCYNSERLIKKNIIALNNQSNQVIPYEVILVDNNCTDRTVQFAKESWTRTDAKLIIVTEKEQGLSHARMTGVKCARYEIISFIDDDNIVEQEWITKVCSLFKSKSNVGVIGSRNEPIIEGKIPFWFKKYQFNYACGSPFPYSKIVKGKRKHIWGAGLSIRTKIIKEIMFSNLPLYLTGRRGSTLSSGEDSEICFRCTLIGWDLWYEKHLTLKHKVGRSRLNWKYLCKLHEGFGDCMPILNIYKRLIDNQPPDSFFMILRYILINLYGLIIEHNIKLFIPYEGEDFQRKFNYYKGFLRSLISLRKSYLRICKDIYSTFG